jgi:hypothetical protein
MVLVLGSKKQPLSGVQVYEVLSSCAAGKTPQQAIAQCSIEHATTNNSGVATLAYPSATESYQFCAQVGSAIQCTKSWTPPKGQGCLANKSFVLTFKSAVV